VSLTDDGPGPHDFPSLASSVAGSTEVIQPPKGPRDAQRDLSQL
jgi:hypothetical protein